MAPIQDGISPYQSSMWNQTPEVPRGEVSASTPRPFGTVDRSIWGEAFDYGLNTLTSTAHGINNGSQWLLDRFYDLGAWWDQSPLAPYLGTAVDPSELPQTQVALNSRHIDGVLQRTQGIAPWWDAEFVNNHFASEYKPSSFVRAADMFGSFLDATTGMLSMAQAYKRDRDSGNTSLSGTMTSMLGSVSQMGGMYATGAYVGGAVAAVAGAGTLPILAGGAAALGAGYAIGKGVEWVRSWW